MTSLSLAPLAATTTNPAVNEAEGAMRSLNVASTVSMGAIAPALSSLLEAPQAVERDPHLHGDPTVLGAGLDAGDGGAACVPFDDREVFSPALGFDRALATVKAGPYCIRFFSQLNFIVG